MNRLLLISLISLISFSVFAQSPKIGPSKVSRAIYFDQTPPLRELIEKASKIDYAENERNKKLQEPRLYPYANTALPKGTDPILQREMGSNRIIEREVLQNFTGQSGYSDPLDNNGSVGQNHYMQSINVSYSIYDKTGAEIIASTAMNTLFAGVPGAENNDGDPIIMYDGQADRWFAAEFSGAYSNPDYMLIAISQTNDPTGSWYRWSFLMNGFPDYMKFGITEDSYLMAANCDDDDVYAFERDAMIAGEPDPQMVQFSNPNRPASGFHTIMPMDTDGPFQPTGSPCQFMTINDDAWDGGSDQLWIFDLIVDWNNTAASTFQRTQTIDVPAFDTDFGPTWNNISQPGTDQELDVISQILMNRVQHRVYGNTQSVVCLHTVDVDNTDHAGLRWYELSRNNGEQWAVRQNGTYAPDGDSRWMGSIAQNDNHEISIGYNVSSNATFPSIRYCGQSSVEYANASGIMDYTETSILEGNTSQTSSNRWGDYANLSIDPADDHTFWFTTSYNISGTQRGSRIASWEFSPPQVLANFVADKLETCSDEIVNLTDLTTGGPETWNWTITPSTFSYVGGTSSTSQNPQVQFNAPGNYGISLEVANAVSNDIITKSSYISMQSVVARFSGTPINIFEGESVMFTEASGCSPDTWSWSFPGGNPNSFTGQSPPPITYETVGTYDVILNVTKSGENDNETKMGYITVNSCSYCSTSYSDLDDDYISNVNIRDIDNSSGGLGYEDFTDISTEINQGNIEHIDISITIGGNWTEHAFVWIDWNHDCEFNDTDEAYDLGETDGTQGIHILSKDILVPNDAILGATGMRIVERFNQDPSPCENETFGEAEDYTVIISEPLSVEADFVSDNLETCPDNSVMFMDQSIGLPNTWEWSISPATFNFVNGTSSFSQNPEIKFNALGNYEISLTASNTTTNTNDTETKANFILVKSNLANFSGTPLTISVGNTVSFTDNSSCSPDTWNWSFPGGNPSSFSGQSPPPITYDTEGTYNVVLNISKSGESDIESKLDYITVSSCNYCSTDYSNTADDYISNVNFVDINNDSNSEGYEDFTDISTELIQGNMENIGVTITVEGAWTQHGWVWIDWNHDCDFDDDGEAYDLGQTDGTQGAHLLSTDIQVPNDAIIGLTTMRVAELYDNNPTSCTNSTYGEAEDYTVVVKAGLPITLSVFKGHSEKTRNVLNWSTETELNFSHFELERSDDGSVFSKLGSIQSKANRNSKTDYIYYDKSPRYVSYYRLKAVDLSGTYEYFNTIFIKRNIYVNEISNIYPNPVDNELNLSVLSVNNRISKVKIISNTGQIVQMRKIELSKGLNKFDFNVFMIPTGRYTLLVDGIKEPYAFIKI